MSREAMKLALEGAANYIDALGGDSRKYRQALANEALDKMAENARELELDYEPAQCKYPKCNYPCPDLPDCRDAEQPAQPQQESVAWQLIETAPQDGTKILGWNEKFGARETQMNFYGEGSLGFAAWKSGKGPKESGWNWSEPKSNWGHTWEPTHWKPLLTPFNTTPPAAPVQDSDHEFKNFHRSLCERFGYVHDEKDWKRDLISLEEWIAKKVQPQQEPVAWMTKTGSVWKTKADETDEPLYTHPPTLSLAQRPHECSRSHPHENMNAMCELRTEIARLTNENARLKALHQDDEINTYRMTLLCIRDGLQQGMSKSIQKLQAREINDVMGLPSFASYRTSPPAQRKPLTDEEIIKCWGQVSGTRYGYVAFARAIEAAHGIKENT